MMRRHLLVAALAAIGVAGCRTVTTDHDKAARIIDADEKSRAALQHAVNDALNTEVRLADDALTESSLLIIELSPPRGMRAMPTRGRNMGDPIQFRLVINRDDCILIDQRDRSRYLLEDTKCKAE
jgi:hypothetical protein